LDVAVSQLFIVKRDSGSTSNSKQAKQCRESASMCDEQAGKKHAGSHERERANTQDRERAVAGHHRKGEWGWGSVCRSGEGEKGYLQEGGGECVRGFVTWRRGFSRCDRMAQSRLARMAKVRAQWWFSITLMSL